MKYRVLYIAIFCTACPLRMFSVANPDSTFAAGNSAYIAGDYAAATSYYLQLIDSGFTDPDICFNLGNAYFRQMQYGKARLWYERTLMYDPGNEDAANNIEVVSSLLVDQVKSKPVAGFSQWWTQLSAVTDIEHWMIWSVVLLFCISLCIGLLMSAGRQNVRIGSFVLAIVLSIVFFCVLSLGNIAHSIRESQNQGVVIRASTNVYSTPSDHSVQLFVIHEGLKVDVLRSSASWSEIALPDGQEGWIPSDDIEHI